MNTGDGWPSERLDEHWNVERSELAELATLTWIPATFEARDAYCWGKDDTPDRDRPPFLSSTPPDDPAVPFRVLPGRWDHEHCEICTASTI